MGPDLALALELADADRVLHHEDPRLALAGRGGGGIAGRSLRPWRPPVQAAASSPDGGFALATAGTPKRLTPVAVSSYFASYATRPPVTVARTVTRSIASGGVQVVNQQVVGRLGLGEADLRRVAEVEGRELARRERSYREGRAPPELAGRLVILVDDGLATGSTMRAAVAAARAAGPARVVVAVPTAPASTCEQLRREADEVVCATTPRPFRAVGYSYRSFPQTTDEEVRELLQAAWTAAET